ncbi:MAG: RelA/SpoT domain-containing protein, partial [Pedococcus sp.]
MSGSTAAPVSEDQERIRDAVQRYADLHGAVQEAADGFVALITALLDDAGINYVSVTGRAKSVSSFAGKAARTDDDGVPLYPDPFEQITDQLGVRVVTYLRDDVTAVADLLSDQLSVLDDR